MTDMRERVARAICESEMGLEMLDAMPNTAPRYYSSADAALLACGYAELEAHNIALRASLKSIETQCGNVIFNCEQQPSDNERHLASWRSVQQAARSSLSIGEPVAPSRSILERTEDKP